MSAEGKHKIAIVGAGSVGATIAYACMMRGVARHFVLCDVNRQKVEAQCLDLNHGLQFVPMATLEGSDDLNICAGSDVIVLAAGAKQKIGQTRLDLAANNVEIYRKMIPALARIAPQAILLMVANPVDVLSYVAYKLSGLPAPRVLGSGTVLDSSRFRYLIARRCDVAVRNVHAYIAGEHGDSEVPLWSSATIGGIPLHEWAVAGHGKFTEGDRTEILQNVKESAARIIQGKGATNYAIGLATARILEALLNDESLVMPVSSLLKDYRGISDVYLSVPAIVNARGAETTLAIPMNAVEEAGLTNSAQIIRASLKTLGM